MQQAASLSYVWLLIARVLAELGPLLTGKLVCRSDHAALMLGESFWVPACCSVPPAACLVKLCSLLTALLMK